MWDDFVAWFQAPAGQRVLDAAVIPALAILVAGVVAALIARGAVRSVLARADREAVSGAVAALVEAARAQGPDGLQGAERERIDRLRTEADVRLRLSGVPGAALAAEWVSLRVDAIERDASSPVPQTTVAVTEVRDRLLAWVGRPRRAKRLFAADVERLGVERTARRTSEQPSAPTLAAPAPTAPTDREQQSGRRPAAAARTAADAGPEREAPTGSPPEPIVARAQNLAHELQAERAKAVAGAADDAAPTAGTSEDAGPSPTTEPVLIQRTRLETMDRQQAEAIDHARHGRPERATAVTVAATAAPAPAPAPAAAAAEPEPVAPEPVSPPAPAPEPTPVGERQATPSWLDTYDDEADVTRDIDLSKTPPPKAASAVRDRTRTGDDIVPRH